MRVVAANIAIGYIVIVCYLRGVDIEGKFANKTSDLYSSPKLTPFWSISNPD
jgi:hypothetical protein